MDLEIRVAMATDIPYLVRLDHSVVSTHVWRPANSGSEAGGGPFKPVALPRPVRLGYPYPPQGLNEGWRRRPGLWIALAAGVPVGYAGLAWAPTPDVAWLTDLVVDAPWRRRGIGRALLRHVLDWAAQQAFRRVVSPISFRNHPAISLALGSRWRYWGFLDGYYPNGDMALFFGRDL